LQNVHPITPCLWFDHEAEEAARFYTAIFKNSRIVNITRYGEAGREIHGKAAGSVLTVAFELDGQSFTALNGDRSADASFDRSVVREPAGAGAAHGLGVLRAVRHPGDSFKESQQR
jgi:predicted 3-demethylubiquinone-9 3-methyltransferase (glyoxalase superfamily)